ncbi:Zinc finger, PMZ-type [Sesbania bispinosa]|nr:Zinc finger, PMZ-type [Sesbania bispinosa]
MEEISDSRSISETEEWGMGGLHLGSKGPVVGKETDNVQQVEGVEHTGGPNLSDNNGATGEAYKFYFEYGFGIRKGRTLKNNKTLEEYQKELMCCRAGQREDRGLKMEDRVREPRALTRCDCKARFHVRVNRFSGRWFCICFEDEHNHDRLGALHCSMLPVYRKMSESDVVQMNNMMKVGIRPPNIFNTFANQSGGYEKIGFRKKDMYNKISEQRRSSCSDAKGALEYLVSETGRSGEWRVCLYDNSKEIKCACLRMESRGLPCEHIVCVLAHLGIDEIPEILVLKRWSKAAKDGLGCKEFEANHCVDVGRRARKAALDGLYDHVSDFKSASIEMFKAERDRLVEDWRQCRADFESEQNLGLGGPTYTHDGPRNPTRASTKGHAVAVKGKGCLWKMQW